MKKLPVVLLLGSILISAILLYPSLALADVGPAGIPQLEYLFARVICLAVPAAFVVLFIILLMAGFKFLTSGGEAKALQSASQTVTWGLLGILFLGLVWLILRLIEAFTGVEVTKFSLSTSPGAPAFTGSCLNPPPIPEIPKLPALVPAARTSGLSSSAQESRVNLVPCSDRDRYITHVSAIYDTSLRAGVVGGVLGALPSSVYLGNPFSYDGFADTLIVPRAFIVLDTSSDKGFVPILERLTNEGERILDQWEDQNIPVEHRLVERWVATQALFRGIVGTADWTVGGSPGGTPMRETVQQLPKGTIPRDVIEALRDGQRSVKKYVLSHPEVFKGQWGLNEGDRVVFEKFDPEKVYLPGFSCPDADYYRVFLGIATPLIYLYPVEAKKIEIALDTWGIVTPNPPLDQDSPWRVKVNPGGVIENGKYRFLYYRFIERPYQRPSKGFMVQGNGLENFLKGYFWKELELTNQEREDYWQDLSSRIPRSDYYLISLVSRSEVDRILPLNINPKPDKVFRNMTYIKPLVLPIPIKPLDLTPFKVKREGFLVVENGGIIDGF